MLPWALLLATLPVAASHAVSTVRVAEGLNQPTYVAAPAGDERLFVVERGGTIRILQDGSVLPTAFLDISDRVDQQGEGGLLSIAFAPDYASSRVFYLFYTAPGNPLIIRISRFRTNAVNPNVADDDVAQEKIVFSLAKSHDVHHGGTVAFGPDDMLYAALGDGGDQGDPDEHGQDPGTLFGKMIRIDVSFSAFTDDYTVPPDNPFVGEAGYEPEIWALGFRNPFRFSFDRLTGDLYIGDVGQQTIEEIDVEPADSGGRNYGWDVMEGTTCYETPDPGEPPCNDPSLTLPVHQYDHSVGLSVTGGVVYRGSRPELQGQYLFADYQANKIWSLVWDGAGGVVGDVVDRTAEFVPPEGTIEQVVAFGENSAGEVYIVDLGGQIFRVPEPANGLATVAGAALLVAVRSRRRR